MNDKRTGGKTAQLDMKRDSMAVRCVGVWIPLLLALGALCLATVIATKPALGCPQKISKLTNAGNENGPKDCRNKGEETSSDTGAGNPVDLLSGRLIEVSTDASLPGTGLGWSHTRTYSSGLAAQSGSLPGLNGEKWMVDNVGCFLAKDGNNIEFYIDAIHKRVFTWNAQSSKFVAPDDYRASLTHYNSQKFSGTADNGSTKTSLKDTGAFENKADIVGQIIYFTTDNSNQDEFRVITSRPDNDTIEWSGDLPATISAGDEYKICDRAVIRFIDSGQTLEFAGVAGNDHNWDARQEGTLFRRSDAYGNTISYKFDKDEADNGGRIIQLTTSQGWTVDYGYLAIDPNKGRISSLTVTNGSGEIIQGVAYVYHDDNPPTPFHGDCGTGGDLILVHVCKDLAGTGEAGSGSDDDTLAHSDASFANDAVKDCKLIMVDGANAGEIRSITASTASTITVSPAFGSNIAEGDSYFVVKGKIKSTHYRYDSSHRLKAVYEPEAVKAIIDDNSNITEAQDILGQADDYSTGGNKQIQQFASRSFTYYTSPQPTNDVDTPWGGNGENLESKYGGAGLDESGYVESETINGVCGSCGGAGNAGVKYTYFYMQLTGQQDNAAEVTRIVVEDVTAVSYTHLTLPTN